MIEHAGKSLATSSNGYRFEIPVARASMACSPRPGNGTGPKVVPVYVSATGFFSVTRAAPAPLPRPAQLHLVGAPGDEVRAAEGGKEVVQSHVIG